MTDYGAYDAGLPCKNPSCKSHGRPHPNCRCYGDMAEGGDASFCSQDRKHKKGCQYFADGDEVSPAPMTGDVPEENLPRELRQPTGDVPEDILPIGLPSKPLAGTAGTQPTGDVPEENLPPELRTPTGDVPNKMLPPDLKDAQYTSPNQQVLTEIEGAAQGAIPFGLSTVAEQGLSALGVPGISDQDIAGREEANPWEHAAYQAMGIVGSQAIPGLGALNVASEISNGITKAAAMLGKYAKAGSKVLGAAITNGIIAGGNEITNWLLGDAKEVPADATGSAMALGVSAALGGLGELVAPGATTALSKATEERTTGKLLWFLNGVHAAAEKTVQENADPLTGEVFGDAKKAYEAGKQIFSAKILAPQAIIGGHAYRSYKENDSVLAGITTFAEDELGLAFAKRVAAPVILKAITSENGPASWAAAISDGLQHGINAVHGSDAINKGVDAVMKGGLAPGIDAFRSLDHRLKERQKLDSQIQSNAFGQSIDKQSNQDLQQTPAQNYAKGGNVSKADNAAPNSLSLIYPKQAMLMATAKARINAYLSKLKPEKIPAKLAFDENPDNTVKKRAYNDALDIANKPLSVLDHIRKGTIEESHVQHLQAMYPETNELLQKKFTEAITQGQVDGKKPTYHTRQGLSLLMGVPLSSELTQPYIAAAQAVFAAPQGQAQPAPASKNKKNTSTLGKASGQYLTGEQARVMDQQKQ